MPLLSTDVTDTAGLATEVAAGVVVVGVVRLLVASSARSLKLNFCLLCPRILLAITLRGKYSSTGLFF